MKNLILSSLTLFSFCFSIQSYAQVNYANDIAEIIYNSCSSCHRDGEIGPFALTNYEEVKAFGANIKYVVENKIMPPWQADPNYSRFLGENYLTDNQINKIIEWVDNGMPRGDANQEPQFPEFPEGSILGTPDLVLTMEEAYLHRGNNQDNYRYFVLPTGLTEDRIVKTMEFRPGNSKIVHHALIFEDTTGEARERDEATPEYGFNGFGSFTNNQQSQLTAKQYPGYVPGQKPIPFPDGTGQVLSAGADLVVQLHYAPWPIDEFDQSSINIFFADETETVEREIQNHIMVPLQQVIGELFFIPPGQVKQFHGRWRVPRDISFLGLSPHMHLLGKDWEVYLEHTDGTIDSLIRVNEWDFNWQGSYAFPKYIVAEQGSTIHAFASYDNTLNNPSNPNNPPQLVTWGEGTEDEMYYLPLTYVEYRDGDEDIVFDQLSSTSEIIEQGNTTFSVAPNPILNNTTVNFTLDQGQVIDLKLYDIEGKLIRNIKKGEYFGAGKHSIWLDLNQLESAQYLLKLSVGKATASQLIFKI